MTYTDKMHGYSTDLLTTIIYRATSSPWGCVMSHNYMYMVDGNKLTRQRMICGSPNYVTEIVCTIAK